MAGLVAALSAQLVISDRMLVQYGPETNDARELLRKNVAAAADRIWPTDRSLTST